MATDQLTMIPEWASQDAVLMVWPNEFMDWDYILDEVEVCYARIIEAILSYESVLLLCERKDRPQALIKPPKNGYPLVFVEGIFANDTWARDFAPISLADLKGHKAVIDFGFNAWGLKFAADIDNTITRQLYHDRHLFAPEVAYINQLRYIYEGGALEADGQGGLMSTSSVLLESNRNPSEHLDKQKEYLAHQLGTPRVSVLDVMPMSGDDTDGHIDTLARFCDERTICYNYTDDPSDPHYALLQTLRSEVEAMKQADGTPYRCIPLPVPAPIIDEEEGTMLPATYANFLIINNAVLLPIYSVPQDQEAVAVIEALFPDRTVIALDCRPLVRQHGSLHCITMQLPEGFVNPELLNH